MRLPRWMLVLAIFSLVAVSRLPAQGDKEKDKQDNLSEPGAEHKLLAKLAGNWDAKIKAWFDPKKPPSETLGSMKRKMILDGRYLQEEFEGKFGEDSFTGLGIIGFDRVKKRFVSTWFDSMSTGVLTSEGIYDDANKTFNYANIDVDPQTGKKMKGRDVLKIDDEDQLTFEMFRTPEGGKEFKVLEIVYKRRK